MQVVASNSTSSTLPVFTWHRALPLPTVLFMLITSRLLALDGLPKERPSVAG